MPDLSIDCPSCGSSNLLPVEAEDESFTCTSCGVTSEIAAAVETGGKGKQPDYLVGEIVSDCKIVEKVGEGGFGSVYKANDQNLQRTVALKVMLPSLTTNVEFVQKFIREAVTAAQLNHPNIVAIHKVGRDERRGLHYLIMEFVEGRTLSDVVKEKGVLSVQEALPVMLQACDALATAHEHNIVHRDIKPENLMVDKAGNVKITDFGLAKSLASDHKTTKVMGTPHYMSPEQFEGKNVDGRSDIYSLGVTFYYLLSKTRPYEGQNTVQIIYSILTQQPKSLTEVNKDVPAPVWAVIEKMIAKRAEDRYQTLRDAITDLRKLQDKGADDKVACPTCGARSPKGRKFCRGCGAALSVSCPACGSQEAAGTKACSACGVDLDRLLRVRKSMEAAKRFQTLGDLRRAAESYRQVLAVDAGNAEAAAELERLSGTLKEVERVQSETQEMMKTGAVEEALGKVEDLLRRYPAASEVRQQRDDLRQTLADRKVNRLVETAEEAAGSGRLRDALEALDQALRIDPSREDVNGLRTDLGRRVEGAAEARQRAVEALAGGRYEEAFSLASEVLKVLPGDTAMEDLRKKAQSSVESVDAFLQRGQERMAARRFSEALAEFEAALGLHPTDAKILALVESARGQIAEQRERMASCRRLLADRRFGEALALLKAAQAEQPDDLEVRSLLSACERGHVESQRAEGITTSLSEADRLEAAGDLAGALAQLDRVASLDAENEVARTRREQIERKANEERALRELVNEHLQDGLFADAVETLNRLRTVNPARAAEYAREAETAKRDEAQVKANLERAEKALAAKEYRRAAEAAAQVLGPAPKHPRAVAIKKDSDKAVAAIDRFLAECDKLLATEMFDEAMEALDKARERGATQEEFKHRRESCEQGRLALLKTDATRSIVLKDFDAAIAAYESVLETRKDDAEALAGKRAAERRVLILTREPLALRLGTAGAVLLTLGLLQFTAIASTREIAVTARAERNVEQEAAKVVVVDTRKLEADLTAATAAETASNWAAAAEAYDRELAEFPGDPALRSGREYVRAMLAADAAADPVARLDALGAAQANAGERADVRARRTERIEALRDAAVRAAADAIASIEASDPNEAQVRYAKLRDHPVARGARAEIERIDAQNEYLEYLSLAESYLQRTPPLHADAARGFKRAQGLVASDPARSAAVGDRLARVRTAWMAEVRARAGQSGADDARWYDEVVVPLEEMGRTFGADREAILREFRGGR